MNTEYESARGEKNNHTNHLRIGFLFSRSHSAKSVEHIEKLLYSLKLEQIALTVYPCLSRQPTSRSYQWKNPSSNSPIFVYSLNRKCKYSFSIYSVKRMRSHIWSQWSIPAHFAQWCTLHNAMQEQCWIGWLCHSTLSFSQKKKQTRNTRCMRMLQISEIYVYRSNIEIDSFYSLLLLFFLSLLFTLSLTLSVYRNDGRTFHIGLKSESQSKCRSMKLDLKIGIDSLVASRYDYKKKIDELHHSSIHTVSLLPAERISPFCGILMQNVAMNGWCVLMELWLLHWVYIDLMAPKTKYICNNNFTGLKSSRSMQQQQLLSVTFDAWHAFFGRLLQFGSILSASA